MQSLTQIIELQNAELQDLRLIGIFLFILLLIAIAVAFTFFIKIASLQTEIDEMHATMVTPEQVHQSFEKIRRDIRANKIRTAADFAKHHDIPTDPIETPTIAPRIISKHY